jgi:hypothetical protein
MRTLGPTYPEIVDLLFKDGSISAAERQLRLDNYETYQNNRTKIAKDPILKDQWVASVNNTIESASTLEAIKAKIANKPNSHCAYVAQPPHHFIAGPVIRRPLGLIPQVLHGTTHPHPCLMPARRGLKPLVQSQGMFPAGAPDIRPLLMGYTSLLVNGSAR